MKQNNIDYVIFFIVLFLIIFGMIMISSVSVYPSFKITSLMVQLGKLQEPSNAFYLERNISHVILGLILFAGIIKTPYQWFETHAKHIFFGTLLLLISVFFIGVEYNGAKGWINIPFLPFSLQPVEFMKIGLIIYLAYFLKRRKNQMHTLEYGFFPFLMTVGIVLLCLALQPDFGSILILAPIAACMYFIGGGSIKALGIGATLAIVGLISVYNLGSYETKEERGSLSYIYDRMNNFLADNKTAIQNKTINFQTEQGLIAIGSGGFFGLGFGKSIQKFGYLPEAQGDFVFSVIAEELGIIGVIVLFGLYMTIVIRGISIARTVSDPFASYLAFGVVIWIIIQASINIGVNLNVLPLTGVTLPFISYGGSSLIALLLGLGILLNISRNSVIKQGRQAGKFARGRSSIF